MDLFSPAKSLKFEMSLTNNLGNLVSKPSMAREL